MSLWFQICFEFRALNFEFKVLCLFEPQKNGIIKVMENKTFTIIDVETTGGSSRNNRIIEIGAIRIQNGEEVDRFHSLLNPETPIPSFITKLTGISDKTVSKAPVFEELKDELVEFFRDSIFVAHNVYFDYGFIRDEFRRVGYGFTLDTLCSVRLSRALFPQYRHHNLDEIIKRFSFSCENRHRALDDALVVWEFMQKVHAEFPETVMAEAYKRSVGGAKLRKTRELGKSGKVLV